MSISDAELARIRGAGSYQAALWVGRVNLLLLPTLLWLDDVWPSAPKRLTIVLNLVYVAGILAGLVLLRRAGAPYVSRGRTWWVEDKRIKWQVLRDLFWFRHPPTAAGTSPTAVTRERKLVPGWLRSSWVRISAALLLAALLVALAASIAEVNREHARRIRANATVVAGRVIEGDRLASRIEYVLDGRRHAGWASGPWGGQQYGLGVEMDVFVSPTDPEEFTTNRTTVPRSWLTVAPKPLLLAAAVAGLNAVVAGYRRLRPGRRRGRWQVRLS